jgi:hypothetical protein
MIESGLLVRPTLSPMSLASSLSHTNLFNVMRYNNNNNKTGDKFFVRCMQYGHRGFNKDVADACGQLGVIMFAEAGGDMQVMFPYSNSGLPLTINPNLLRIDESGPSKNTISSPSHLNMTTTTTSTTPKTDDFENLMKNFNDFKSENNFIIPEYGKLPPKGTRGDRYYTITEMARKVLEVAVPPLMGEKLFTIQIPSIICTGMQGQVETWKSVERVFGFVNSTLKFQLIQKAIMKMRAGNRNLDEIVTLLNENDKAIVEHIFRTVIEMESDGRCFNSFQIHRDLLKRENWPLVLGDCILKKLPESDWQKFLHEKLPQVENSGWHVKQAAIDMRNGVRDIVKLTRDVDTGSGYVIECILLRVIEEERTFGRSRRLLPEHLKGDAQEMWNDALRSKEPWNQVKLMIIGNGRAGKTSLKRSLIGLKHSEEEESTVGADLVFARRDASGKWKETERNEAIKDIYRKQAAKFVSHRLKAKYHHEGMLRSGCFFLSLSFFITCTHIKTSTTILTTPIHRYMEPKNRLTSTKSHVHKFGRCVGPLRCVCRSERERIQHKIYTRPCLEIYCIELQGRSEKMDRFTDSTRAYTYLSSCGCTGNHERARFRAD